MKRLLPILLCSLLLSGLRNATAQEASKTWTLQECLDYAYQNNIQVRQSRNNQLSGIEDTKQAKAALFPSLVASTTQSYTNYPSSEVTDNNSYTGTYGITAGMTIFEGGKLRTEVKRQKVQNQMDALSVEESVNDIRIAIVQAYMQCLYAADAVRINRSTAEASKAQRDRAEEMLRTGSISRVDFAQLQSQYSSDEYQIVVAGSTLDNYKLQLKQLLELDIMEEMNPAVPGVKEENVLKALPPKNEVYETALKVMPQIRRGELGIEAAKLEEKSARAGFFPSISLSASVGTGHMSNNDFESGSQIWNRFNENVGLTLNIPIFSNRKNRTAVNKAKIALNDSYLEWTSLQKELLRNVESAYLDAVSAQAQYLSAREKEKYAR
ncbi:TolC family protein, partial [Alistipes putredinis]